MSETVKKTTDVVSGAAQKPDRPPLGYIISGRISVEFASLIPPDRCEVMKKLLTKNFMWDGDAK